MQIHKFIHLYIDIKIKIVSQIHIQAQIHRFIDTDTETFIDTNRYIYK